MRDAWLRGPRRWRTHRSVWRPVVAAGAAAYLGASCGSGGGRQGPLALPVPHPFERDWILLATPQVGGGLDVGVMFSGTGDIDTTCYTVSSRDTTRMTGGSLDRMQVRWMTSGGGDLHLRLAALFGVEAAARRIQSGTIRFDSVVIRRAREPLPANTCDAPVDDGLPRGPVVTSLIGARSFSLESDDSLSLRAAVDSIRVRQVQLGATIDRRSSRSVEIAFSSLRWIGATYMGFEPGSEDSVRLPNQQFGRSFSAGWNWDVRIDRRGDRFVAFVTRTGAAGETSDSLPVTDNRQFLLQRRATRAEFFRARFEVTPTGSQVLQFTNRRSRLRECRWTGVAQRQLLEEWEARRRDNRPADPRNCS